MMTRDQENFKIKNDLLLNMISYLESRGYFVTKKNDRPLVLENEVLKELTNKKYFSSIIKKIANSDSMLDHQKLISLAFHIYETKEIKGHIAEVGVYKCGSAKIICEAILLSKSLKTGYKMLAFDTFNGFDADELNNHELQYFSETFKDTNFSDALVEMSKFQFCEVIQGSFPSESGGHAENNSFKLVHLDIDSFIGTKKCLKFFYKRMAINGVILIEDLSSLKASGVREALGSFIKYERQKKTPRYRCSITHADQASLTRIY